MFVCMNVRICISRKHMYTYIYTCIHNYIHPYIYREDVLSPSKSRGGNNNIRNSLLTASQWINRPSSPILTPNPNPNEISSPIPNPNPNATSTPDFADDKFYESMNKVYI
jgi:hypothetical protein